MSALASLMQSEGYVKRLIDNFESFSSLNWLNFKPFFIILAHKCVIYSALKLCLYKNGCFQLKKWGGLSVGNI